MKMSKYKTVIEYIILEGHPDVPNPTEEIRESWDIYTFDENYGYSEDYKKDYMVRDLALIASGGYTTKYIKLLKTSIIKL